MQKSELTLPGKREKRRHRGTGGEENDNILGSKARTRGKKLVREPDNMDTFNRDVLGNRRHLNTAAIWCRSLWSRSGGERKD